MFHVCDLECKEYTNKNHPIPGRWQIDNWMFDRCPKTYITENVEYWMKAYGMFQTGRDPRSGGWFEQSNKYVEAMLFIDQLIKKQKQMEQNSNGRQ